MMNLFHGLIALHWLRFLVGIPVFRFLDDWVEEYYLPGFILNKMANTDATAKTPTMIPMIKPQLVEVVFSAWVVAGADEAGEDAGARVEGGGVVTGGVVSVAAGDSEVAIAGVEIDLVTVKVVDAGGMVVWGITAGVWVVGAGVSDGDGLGLLYTPPPPTTPPPPEAGVVVDGVGVVGAGVSVGTGDGAGVKDRSKRVFCPLWNLASGRHFWPSA
jgi:hypothetical protein